MIEVNKVYNEDCFNTIKKIKDKSIDLVLTDPPFGMSFQSNHRKDKHKKIANDDNLEWLGAWVDEIARVVKDDSHIYVFCSWHKVDIFKQELERHFKIKNLMVWSKNGGGMGDLKGGYGGVHELCFFINNGRNLNGKRDVDVIRGAYRTGNNNHPTEKPINLMEYLIEKSSSRGDLILDTFAGGGSTLIAAKRLGRDFIGVELDSDYYKVICDRIEKEASQVRMFL